MTRTHLPPALAAAFVLASAAASAQLTTAPSPTVSLRTQVTPAVLGANRYSCQVTNLSSQAVTLVRLDLYGAGQVLAPASCAGNATLAPGGSCAVTLALTLSTTTGIPVYCRAQHLGPDAAVAGSLQAFLLSGVDNRAVASAPMQPITDVALAP